MKIEPPTAFSEIEIRIFADILDFHLKLFRTHFTVETNLKLLNAHRSTLGC